MILRSPLLSRLGVVHGFSTRERGVSEGRYASLNLGAKWGDAPERVAENRRRFAATVGFALERLYTATQVHGARVLVVAGAEGQGPPSPEAFFGEEADALASRVPGAALGVFTADCVPILLADGEGRAAAAHAGWRGTVADVAGAAARGLVSVGAAPARLVAAMGPSICPACFEVGEEVAAAFAGWPAAVRRDLGPKPHVDLYEVNRAQLLAAGVHPEHIDVRPPCTMCEPARFFSFRRDGGHIGQQLSVVVSGVA